MHIVVTCKASANHQLLTPPSAQGAARTRAQPLAVYEACTHRVRVESRSRTQSLLLQPSVSIPPVVTPRCQRAKYPSSDQGRPRQPRKVEQRRETQNGEEDVDKQQAALTR
uniref:Uncharacterized protein n=1 Tax=Haptolina ericina TaxID=156174 RepID=A0A7S3BTR7_9EUKA